MMNTSPKFLLEEIQAAHGWGQTAIAEKLGISQATLSRIMNELVDCRASTLAAILKLHAEVCAGATSE
ncbi:helix-turn-helix domain-containing protein [Achromobacter ruhlandii]|uniref:helix-turn-helix domain-containing protein n=1 Tax=Achromobacter ruhlandii TaxID=72557 RepID=UPI003B9F1E77